MSVSHWISTFAIFGVLVLSTLGRKRFNWLRLLLPVAILGFFGAKYLQDIPGGGNNALLLGISILIGGIIGIALALLTRTEYDQQTGITYVISHPAGIALFSLVFLLRMLLIAWVTHHGQQAYLFAVRHHFDLNLLGPLFIFMAGSMIIVRVGGVLAKVRRSRTRRLIKLND